MMFKTHSDNDANKGDWVKTVGSLTLKVLTALVAGTEYRFAFDVQNKATAQTAPTVQIAATVAAGANIAAADMTAGSGDAAPLLTVLQNYFSIGQSNPVAGGTNTITVTIISAIAMAAADTVTITALKGADTADNAVLALGGAASGQFQNADTANKGIWVKDDGKLTLNVKTYGVPAVSPPPTTFSVSAPAVFNQAPFEPVPAGFANLAASAPASDRAAASAVFAPVSPVIVTVSAAAKAAAVMIVTVMVLVPPAAGLLCWMEK